MEPEQRDSLFYFYNDIIFPGISLRSKKTAQIRDNGGQSDEDEFDSELHALDQRNTKNQIGIGVWFD